MLAETPEPSEPLMPERLIAESTAYCRDSSRLMWIVLDWLARHADQLDADQLLDLTRLNGDIAVLRLLCDMALERGYSAMLHHVRASCTPHPSQEIFFHRVARSPLASSLAKESPLAIYQRWNFLGRELVQLGG